MGGGARRWVSRIIGRFGLGGPGFGRVLLLDVVLALAVLLKLIHDTLKLHVLLLVEPELLGAAAARSEGCG